MKSFNEVFEDKTKYGTKIKTSEYCEMGAHLIIDQGQEQVAGYTDIEEGVFEEVPVIIFGDHTRVIKYVDKPFFLGADGVKVLRSKFKNANYKYLYYALKNARIPNTGYNRHFKWLKEVQIEYPDYRRQENVVKILDKVSDLIETRQHEIKRLETLSKPDLSTSATKAANWFWSSMGGTIISIAFSLAIVNLVIAAPPILFRIFKYISLLLRSVAKKYPFIIDLSCFNNATLESNVNSSSSVFTIATPVVAPSFIYKTSSNSGLHLSKIGLCTASGT